MTATTPILLFASLPTKTKSSSNPLGSSSAVAPIQSRGCKHPCQMRSYPLVLLSVHVGQAGVQIGNAFWEMCAPMVVSLRTRLSYMIMGFSALFSETSSCKHVPRSLSVNMDPNVIDDLQSGTYRSHFRPENLVADKEDAACNYAHENQYCDAQDSRLADDRRDLQSPFAYHLFGGGTGFGSGALFSVNPAPEIANPVVEPYNYVLRTHTTLKHSDCSFMVDNEAMDDIRKKRLNITSPGLTNLNKLIAQVVSSIAGSLRFDVLLNINLNELQTKMVPFPLTDMTFSCFETGNKNMACALLYRGDATKQTIQFVDWCPTGFKLVYLGEIKSILPCVIT
ncbi:Tubulin/FtsZ, GTPase domain-containing protein [Cytidiella melzeri]|nr:Tubulin/FtsZ, GTPase domain-containing protein [Cytidiella melzeri]